MDLRSLLGLSPREERSYAGYAGPIASLGDPWHLFGFGRKSDSGEVVTSQTAMQQATVNACVRLISESIASMSPILYEKSGTGRKEAFSHPLHDILALEPNEDCSAFTLWDAFVGSIALTGNGYLEITRNGSGAVTGLYFLNPHVTNAYMTPNGALTYRTGDGLQAGQFRELRATSVVHVPWFSLNGITGISVIEQNRAAIGGAIAMDKHAGRFFANNATPSGILSSPKKYKPEDKTRMRTEWETLQSGANQHRIAVLDDELKFEQISISQADSQFLESRNMSRQEICGLFRVHPSQIGDTARVAGETYAAQQLTFLNFCLRPWLNRIGQELTRKLLRGLPNYSITHDVSTLLELDFETQMKGFAAGRQWGFYTANEIRAKLGENPYPAPEADLLICPVNMMSAARLSLPPSKPTETVMNE